MSSGQEARSKPSTTKIFISHSTKDEEAVNAFLDLLMTGANVNTEEIFASSVPGTDVPTGENFVEGTRKNLLESELVVLFITPNFYASEFCLAEMGAAWIQNGKDIFPLVADDLSSDIGASMLGTQTRRFTKEGVGSLYDKIQEVLSERDWPTPLWSAKQAHFLRRFEEIYPKLPKPEKVDRAEFDNAVAERNAVLEELEAMRSKLEDEKAHRQEVEKLKDREQLRAIEKQYTDVHDQYEDLLSQAQERLRRHSPPEQRALYAEFEEGLGVWRPEQSTLLTFSDEIQRALGEQRIETGSDDDLNEIWARKQHPDIGNTIDVLNDLDLFLINEEDFAGVLEERHEFPINIANRQYWREILLKGEGLLQ